MNIPKSVINKEFTFPKICGYAKKDSHTLNGIEREVIKRIKEGNFDPRKEIKSEITGSYIDQGSRHTSSVKYGLLEQLEEVRQTVIKEMKKAGIMIVDTKDSKGRKKIEIKIPGHVQGFTDDPLLFDNIMKATLTKYMGKHGKHIMELGY